MSTRITKALASEIARKLTETRKNQLVEMQATYQNTAKEIYLSQVPKEILDFFNKYPDWCESTCYISLDGYGFRESFSIEENVPTSDGYARVKMNNEISSQLNKLKRAYEKGNQEYAQLLRELQAAIFSSSTYAKLEEHFPEAAKLLPQATYNPPAINYDKLREKLKQVA